MTKLSSWQIYAPMFAERESVREAFAYAHEIAKASENPAAVMMAVHMVANTLAKEIERINQESSNMKTFNFSANAVDYGNWSAATKDEAQDKFAIDAGY